MPRSDIWFLIKMYSLLAGVPAAALVGCALLWRWSDKPADSDRAQLIHIGIGCTASAIVACLAALGIASLPQAKIPPGMLPLMPLLCVVGALSACVGVVLPGWNGRGFIRISGIILGLFALTLSVLFGLGSFVAPG